MNSSPPSKSHSASQRLSSSHRYKFTFIEAARGITRDGIQASFQTYESSDGITVFTRTEFFRSAADMRDQFKKSASRLSEILERNSTQESSKDGLRNERLVGRNSPDKGMENYSIIWNHENRISYIESISLSHNLDFERQFYKTRKR